MGPILDESRSMSAAPMTRPRKQRALQKAGFAYVAGWLPADRAKAVTEEIETVALLVQALLEKEAKDGAE